MNIDTEVILLAFARDWYFDAAARYSGKTGEHLRECAEAIQNHLNGRIEQNGGKKDGDSGQE